LKKCTKRIRLQSKKSIILMVLEGVRTEPQIVDNLKRFFLQENTDEIVYALYGNVVYDIYLKLKEGETFLDIVPILKEMPRNQDELVHVSRDDVSQVYLFFDLDAHSHVANMDQLEEMLTYFDDETDQGKLFISYPMVEALKHLSKEVDFSQTRASIVRGASYKSLVETEADSVYKHIRNYDRNLWEEVIEQHGRKLGYLMEKQWSFPSQYFSQKNIFLQQKNQHILPNQEVAVLGSFPVFLMDYYGYEYFKKQEA